MPSHHNASVGAELELLLQCSRSTVNPETLDDLLHRRGREIHWSNFLDLARRHKVMPLIHGSLKWADHRSVPAEVMNLLGEHCRTNARQNLALMAELNRVLVVLTASGVEAVPFKGLSLAAYAYRDINLREAGDLDLLVRRADVRQVSQSLRDLGYEPDRRSTPDDDQRRVHSRYDYHLIFKHPQTGIVVEPHWGIMPPFYSPDLDHHVNRCWDGLIRQRLMGSQIAALAPTDLLIFLAVHGGRHLWQRVNWICDVAEIVRTETTLDWARLLNTAKATHQQRHLAIALLLASEMLDAAIPRYVADELFSLPSARRLVGSIHSWLSQSPDWVSKHLYFIRAFDRRRDRLRWICHQLLVRV